MGSSSKQSSGGSRSYDYYGTIAGAVCLGPADEIVAIIVDDKRLWDGGGSGLARGEDPTDTITTDNGDIQVLWGTTSQTQHALLADTGNDAGEDHPAYKGVVVLILDDFLFGRERNSPPNVEVVVRRKPNQSLIDSSYSTLQSYQANLAAVAAEWLTDTNGVGLAAAQIDDASLEAVAEILDGLDEIAHCSPLLAEQAILAEVWDELALLTDAFLRYNAADDIIEAGLFSHDTEPASYTTLTVDDLMERPKLRAEGFDAVKTGAVVNFSDRDREFKASSERADDQRAWVVRGTHDRETYARPFITRRAQARRHAAEVLRTAARPQTSATIVVRRWRGRTIRPGDYVKMDIDLEPGGSTTLQFFRVNRREIPFTGPITLELEAEEQFTPIGYAPDDSTPTDTTPSVPPISYHRIIECPAALADDHPSVLALCERPDLITTSFRLWFDTNSGGTFQKIGRADGFALRAVLRSALTDSATTVEITVPSQADTTRLTEEVSALLAADDTLLAFLIERASGASAWATSTAYSVGAEVTNDGWQYVCITAHTSGASTEPGTGADWAEKWQAGGAVAEDANGYAEAEVASISAISLVSGSNYDLTVIRARKGTTARAFTTAAAELWIIPRAVIEPLTHADLATIRVNRAAGDTPATGYFRLQPLTYGAERELSDCANIEFQLPPVQNAAPRLLLETWEASTAYSVGDYVWHANELWRCKTAHTSASTWAATNWDQITSDGAWQWPHNWVSGRSYAVGEYVWQSSTYYRCKTANSDVSFTSSNWDNVSSPTAWAAATAYSVGDVRGHNDQTYICTAAHTSSAAWSSGSTYAADDIVVHDGQEYRSLAGSNTNHEPPNATWWAPTTVTLPPAEEYWSVAHPFGYEVDFIGTWYDTDSDMINLQVIVRQNTDDPETEEDDSFAPSAEAELDEEVNIAGSGTWVVTLRATDALGLVGELVYTITAVGSVSKVKRPKFYQHGKKLTGTEYNRWGEIQIKCKTAGATIYYRYGQPWVGGVTWWGAWHEYQGKGGSDEQPIAWKHGSDVYIESVARKTGMIDSDVRRLTIREYDPTVAWTE